MNVGKTLFAQIMEFVPWTSFGRIVYRYSGNADVQSRASHLAGPTPPAPSVGVASAADITIGHRLVDPLNSWIDRGAAFGDVALQSLAQGCTHNCAPPRRIWMVRATVRTPILRC